MNLKDIGRKFLIKTIGGRLKYQGFFEMLFLISCHGMNIGGLGDVGDSGESLVLKNIRNKIKNKPVYIFDVGANQGNYSLMVLDIFKGVDLNLFSFEPSNFTFKILKKKLGKNNSNLFNFGLGEKEESRILFTTEKGLGLASLYQRNLEEYNMKMDIKEEVNIQTLDNFCKKNKIKKIDLLKIDVEGHEFSVLKGAEKMINSDSIDYIQFEFGCNYDSKTYFKDFFYLLNPRYEIYRILKDGLYPIKEYKWTNEIFNAINYLAINRKTKLSKNE